MTLTQDQAFALEAIVDWIDNDDESFTCALIGPAGTGKTFLVNEILKKCKYNFGVAVSAPTHKAKNVISLVTEKQSLTVQAVCGLAPNTDIKNFNINKPVFGRKNAPQMGLYKVLPIDESSMINTSLLTLIKELAKKHKTKILFIGDGYQVPPVGEVSSPVFTECDYTYTLLQPVRQKPNNPLVVLLNAIRCDITTLTHGFSDDEYKRFVEAASILIPDLDFVKLNNDIDSRGKRYREHIFRYLCIHHPKIVNNNGEGYEFTRDAEYFESEVLSKFSTEHFKLNPNYCRVCTFTNDSVSKWNKLIRNAIIPSNAILVLEELLMSYVTLSRSKTDVILTNSQEYEIVDLKETIKDNLKGWEVICHNIGDNTTTPPLFIVHPDSYEAFALMHEAVHYNARTKKGKAWPEYFKWKREYLLMHSLNDRKTSPVKDFAKANNIALYNLPKKDIDYGCGITTHKSQGSTYNYSFVDGNNISIRLKVGKETDTEKKIQYFNLLYVALSRAKEKSLILI